MRNKTVKNTWGMPLLLACLTLFGLLAALLGTGVWYVLSWLAMLIPVFSMLWHISKFKAAK